MKFDWMLMQYYEHIQLNNILNEQVIIYAGINWKNTISHIITRIQLATWKPVVWAEK